MSPRPLIGLDWGTSSLRGARFAADGALLEERSFARGILTVEPGGFAQVFDEHFGDWMAAPGALCLISGMAGSKQGWVEVPYCACPCGLEELANHLVWVEADRIAIVPGLKCERGGVPDVLRGEETQAFGALRLLEADRATLVLPGTHSKWVRAEGGRISSFVTLMTGEVYGLLRNHSILSRTLPKVEDPTLRGDAFEAGVAHALRCTSLLESAFSVRTLALFDRTPEAERPSYLSGVVIGEELRSRALSVAAASGASRPVAAEGERVVVIGERSLTDRYSRALALCGVRAQSLGAEAAWRGLSEIERTLRS